MKTKIYAFTDIHGSLSVLKRIQSKIRRYKPDFVFCPGDFTVFGQGQDKILSKINMLHKKIFILHGNHESGNELKKMCKKYPNITFADKQIIKLGKFLLVAHGGGGFYGCGKDL